MIVVTGASGITGLAVLRALGRCGTSSAGLRAVVGRQGSAVAVRAAGAGEVVVGDLESPATARHALQGAKKLYHICPRMSPSELQIGRHLIAAGIAAGLEHFVFHSLVHAQCDAMGHHRDKRLVEEALLESPLPYTFMQPTMYMQNLLQDWGEVREKGVWRLPYSMHARMSLVDLEDVAEAAARVLTEPGWDGGAFELCSGERLTRVQMCEAIAAALGRDVRAQSYPVEEWKPLGARSRTPWQVERVAAMFGHYDRFGLHGGNGRVLGLLLGREPTRYAAFVQRLVHGGAL
ncbi:MAG: NmrA family NAD(P)-binding protein [Betaproteobacteria bacterium]